MSKQQEQDDDDEWLKIYMVYYERYQKTVPTGPSDDDPEMIKFWDKELGLR